MPAGPKKHKIHWVRIPLLLIRLALCYRPFQKIFKMSKKLSYRQKLKNENPAKYKQYLEQQRTRNKKYRANMKKIFKSPNASPDEREKYRKYKEAAATRQRKYRKRKLEDVEQASKVPVAKKMKTRNETKERQKNGERRKPNIDRR